MKIEFDSHADALYITLRKGKFAKNRIIDDETILDLDSKGRILGIELLNISKRIPAKELSIVSVKAPLKVLS